MTRDQEIQELIGDQSSGTAERHALEAVAARLQDSLTREVPFRPEFKVRLRQQLVAEARRTLTPWYRRPAVWAPSLGVAAAAAVLAVGLQVYRGTPHDGLIAESVAPVQTLAPDTMPPTIEVPSRSFYVRSVKLPLVVLPDENVPPGQAAPAPESVAGLDLSQGLRVFLLDSAPDMAQFTRIATGLGFTKAPGRNGLDFTVDGGGRVLSMSADGHVRYTDQAPVSESAGAEMDAEGAKAAARRFLEVASLPVPDFQPVVHEVPGTGDGRRIFTVTYTPRVDGRPVANARTVVTVGEGSRVLRADAYVYAREQPADPHSVISPDAALAEARKPGDGPKFGGEVDLVYVRTVSGQAVYLQPSWRVFGTGDEGVRVIRYVPAVAPQAAKQ